MYTDFTFLKVTYIKLICGNNLGGLHILDNRWVHDLKAGTRHTGGLALRKCCPPWEGATMCQAQTRGLPDTHITLAPQPPPPARLTYDNTLHTWVAATDLTICFIKYNFPFIFLYRG